MIVILHSHGLKEFFQLNSIIDLDEMVLQNGSRKKMRWENVVMKISLTNLLGIYHKQKRLFQLLVDLKNLNQFNPFRFIFAKKIFKLMIFTYAPILLKFSTKLKKLLITFHFAGAYRFQTCSQFFSKFCEMFCHNSIGNMLLVLEFLLNKFLIEKKNFHLFHTQE